jgi:predicted DNA-binding transcriptional regulator AlpA
MTAQLLKEIEVAKLLRVSRSTVRKLLPSIRLSPRGKRYRLSDILKLQHQN